MSTNTLHRALLVTSGLLLSSTIAFSTTTIELKGDQSIVYPCGGRTCISCGPATQRTCAVIRLGEGNPGGGYPDKATLYSMDSQISEFNCIYLVAGPSGDPTQDATVIPEP